MMESSGGTTGARSVIVPGLAVATAVVLAVWSLRFQTFWIEPLLGGWALAWVGLLGLAGLVRGRRQESDSSRSDRLIATGLLGVAIFGLAVAACARLGARSLDLPPGMHDEFSYLFQAETYLKGRLWLPSQNVIPGLFDQIHVLNEGRFASRYFPGTGLWLAPFVAIGAPYVGQWIAAGLAALLIFDAGRTVGGTRVGLVAGTLVALAPGVAEFCNVLVSHAPTLLGLALFLCGYARARAERTPDRFRFAWAMASGSGLALAMLCRPLTAAAIGLPFGISLVGELAATRFSLDRRPEPRLHARDPRRSLMLLVATGIPVAFGLLFLAVDDAAITGSIWKTPYGLYNDLYTPRHVYGFDNGTRGDAIRAAKRDVDYDRWARNLTWPVALRNARARLKYSLKASIGTIAFAVGVVVVTSAFVAGRRRASPFWLACTAAIACLHLAYLPYWFVGIHAYHYVFESIPLYALVFAGSVEIVGELARAWDRPLLTPAWALLAVLPALWQWLPLNEPLQTQTGLELERGTSFEASRRQHQRFLDLVDEQVRSRPALVLVKQPPVNFHVDYVVNSPMLDATVLFGRFDPVRMTLRAIGAAFPDRTLYLFDERSGELARVAPSDPD